MRRVYIAIPVPERSLWRLLADPSDCPPGFMIIGTLAAVRRGQRTLQTSALRPVLSLPSPARESSRVSICPSCPFASLEAASG